MLDSIRVTAHQLMAQTLLYLSSIALLLRKKLFIFGRIVMTGKYMSKTKAELMAESKKRKLSIKSSLLKAEVAEELVKDDRRKKRVAAKKKSATAKPSAKKKSTSPKPVAKKTSRPKRPSSAKKKRNWDIKIDGEKFYVAKEEADYLQPDVEDVEEAQQRYNETTITAMARDPFTIYLYWELADEAVEKARSTLGESLLELRFTLRVYESFDGAELATVEDITIDPASDSAYITVTRPGSKYSVAIGLAAGDGTFETIATSNSVTTPIANPSHTKDPEWPVSDEIIEEIYILSGGGVPIGSSVGASEAYLLRQKRKMGISSFGETKERRLK